jgi:hypothetical protein
MIYTYSPIHTVTHFGVGDLAPNRPSNLLLSLAGHPIITIVKQKSIVKARKKAVDKLLIRVIFDKFRHSTSMIKRQDLPSRPKE